LVAERGIDVKCKNAETSLLNHGNNVSYGTTPSLTCQNAEAPTFVEVLPCLTSENCNGSFYTLAHRPLVLVFLNYMFLTFLDIANSVLFPLMYSTPLEYGGLRLAPFYIGTTLGCFGIMNVIFQAKFLGKLMRYLGKQRLYQIGILYFFVSFLMFPVMKYFAQNTGRVDMLVWICIAIHINSGAMLSMAYSKELGLILCGSSISSF